MESLKQFLVLSDKKTGRLCLAAPFKSVLLPIARYDRQPGSPVAANLKPEFQPFPLQKIFCPFRTFNNR